MSAPTTFTERCTAAFLGLALGDAWGAPLEFISGPRVRTAPVSLAPGNFHWTDDTHMALYLAEALLLQGPDTLDPHAFGQAVGEQFSAWLDDPLTPHTAPGNSCMAGVRAWRRCRDWRQSGLPDSDGCGAVMRIAPLAMALAGPDLTTAAQVSASVTHRHPNAIEAAIAASHLLRLALEQAHFGPDLVQATIDGLRGPWNHGGVVATALEAALAFAARPAVDWLDEAAIPTGDGGWRSASALGLAVAAALRWGQDFRTAVDRAARIYGDSDSVACLAGMFLGAAGGLACLPAEWLAVLPRRDHMEVLAQRLAAWGRPWVVLADPHGNTAQVAGLLNWADAHYADPGLVLLGDYCDNGPDVPGLLDLMLAQQARRGLSFVPIIGNHDLACLRALGWPGDEPNAAWYERWSGRYWDGAARGTPAAYGAHDLPSFVARYPPAHRALLAGLPWMHDTGRFLFVHGGMTAGPLAPQREALQRRQLPEVPLYTPTPLWDKRLSVECDTAWDRVVISGHTRRPGERARWGAVGPHFVGPNRICLSAEVVASGALYALVLPERRWLRMDAHGPVQDLGVAPPSRQAGSEPHR